MENINIQSLIGKSIYLVDEDDPFCYAEFFGKISNIEIPEGKSFMYALLYTSDKELPMAIGSLISLNKEWHKSNLPKYWVITISTPKEKA